MNKIYLLEPDLEKYASFVEQVDNIDDLFIYKYANWKQVDLSTYEPVKYKLVKSNRYSKKYTMDISIDYGLIILSEKAVEVLKDIIEDRGQLIPIITESEDKKYYGFYPNKNTYDISIINLEKTDYRQAEKGKIFHKIVLNNTYPKDDYLFVIYDDLMKIFVTDKFKKLVEDNKLKGLDFYREVKVID